MRSDGHTDHARVIGADDGAAGGKRIAGGASRRRYNHAVTAQAVDMMAGHRDVEFDHIGQGPARKRHIVEGKRAHNILRAVFANRNNIGGDGGTAAHMELAGQGIAHDLQNVALLGARGRQKTQMTIGKTQNGNLTVVENAGGTQQRAVAAERNNQVGIVNIGRALDLGALVGSPYDLVALAR